MAQQRVDGGIPGLDRPVDGVADPYDGAGPVLKALVHRLHPQLPFSRG
ncbi:hypothetical protein [Streptomyces sp. S4.7]|nr:hypothetical protein [Streptomyces sp. S4.7]